jgi:multicomponent Na+:H+ antiporter subunit G
MFWDIVSKGCILIGAFFMFVAGLGLLRMPDIYMRLHTNTKSATFGVGFLLLGAAIHLGEFTVGIRALAIMVFLFATAPVAAHMIGRAAYISKAPLWENTLGDDLEGKYDKKTHELTAQAETQKTEKGKRKKES